MNKKLGLGLKDSDTFGLRWFTPTTEVPLCGHATLATAAAVFFHLENSNKVRKREKSNILKTPNMMFFRF